MKFTGIPNFAPELFRRIRLKDPLKQKQLLKGLVATTTSNCSTPTAPTIRSLLAIGRKTCTAPSSES
jgi:hypothetical protein